MSNSGGQTRSSESVLANSLPSVSPRLCNCDVHGGHFVDCNVQDIERFIHEEMKELHEGFHSSRKERFSVFKKAFEMLIDESVSFKPVLSEINAEYLGVTTAVERGEQQRSCISRDLKCVVGEKITMENYEKRIADLEYKAKLIRTNNDQLRVKYEHLEQEKKEICEERKTAINKNMHKQSRLVLPGLKMEEQTNVDVLSSALAKLQLDVKAMQESTKVKYFPKERKRWLEQDLQMKERSKKNVSNYNDALRERLGRVTVAIEAAKSTKSSSGHVPSTELADVVLKALNDYERMDSSRRRDPLQQHITTDDDDPLKKKESEKLLSYIEHFNDLLEFAQYEAAAIHAATSPMAILRTPQALQKFKEVDVYDGPKSPLFLYCEALMTTSVVEDSDDKTLHLSSTMSLECITCALNESGINLAIHWLSHPSIVTSVPLANLFVNWCICVGNCRCRCQALAEGIYRKFEAHQQVANTLARQGKHRAVIEYGRTSGHFQIDDYKEILESNPTVFYAVMLLQANLNSRKMTACGISYCSILNILLGSNEEILLSFLEHVYSTGVCDGKGIKHSTSDLIFQERSSDGMTTEKWNRVINLCCSNNHSEIAMEILSTLLVRQALNHASISSSLDYIS